MTRENKLLTIFFVLLVLKQIIWIAVIPVFHTPDEQAHFAQVQNIAESNIPGKLSTSKELMITEKYLDVYRDSSGNNKFTYHPEYRIQYTKSTTGKYEKEIKNINQKLRKKLTMNEATWYPPLYYQYAAVGYRLAYQDDLIGRIFFVRLWQSIFYLLSMYLFYRGARLIFSDKKSSLIFLLFAAFLPMPSYVGAGVTSDNLMNVLFTAVIFLSLLCLKHGFSKKNFTSFIMICILGFITKPHFVIALPVYISAVFFRLWYERRIKIIVFSIISVVLAAFAVGSYVMMTRKAFFLDIAGVLFAKEKVDMPLIKYFFMTMDKTYHETLPWFWGIYRWLSLAMPLWFYRIWNLLTAVAIFSFIFFLVKQLKKRKSVKFYQLLFLITAAAVYFLIIFGWDYLFFLSRNFTFGLQGRYFFPVLFPFVFLLFYFLRLRRLHFILALFSVFINFFTLQYLAKSYYDFASTEVLLNQLSQYKPWYLKGMNFVVLFTAYLLCLVIFLIQLIKYAKEKH